jgi:glucose uptake protein GlcU
MASNPLATDEMFYAAALIGILLGFSFNIACMVLIIVKRKYFLEEIKPDEELPS